MLDDRQERVDNLFAQYLPPESEREHPPLPSQPVDLDDRELLERAMRARNGDSFADLWQGSWKGRYDSHSEADLALAGALAFWTGRDPGRIDALFRSSGLMRDKWDSRRGETTYGSETVTEAVAGCREVYDPQRTHEPPVAPTARSGAASASGGLALRSLRVYAIRRVIWLDKWFLQGAAFHLLAGRKGSLKGTFIALLAALVTRGELYGEPKRVLVVTSEDSVELDFKPRVLAAGGDEKLVEIVTGEFRMPRDLDWLRRTALELGDVGLIAIDPIGNHLGGADTDKEGLVREAIQDLNPLADELDCMVFGVRHLGKDVSKGALASVLGSTAWVDVPRCVILMAADDEDERLFHAQVVAGNRGPRNHGRVYRLELVDVPPAIEITLAVPQGDSTKDVEELLGIKNGATSKSKSARARELILDLLEACAEIESDELDARIARETNLAARTVKNIRKELREAGLVAAHPEKDENGTIVRWLVRRTRAARDDQEPQKPDKAQADREPEALLGHPGNEKPHNQATSPSGALESVSRASGNHKPVSQSEQHLPVAGEPGYPMGVEIAEEP